ncbi:hypothetical protein BCR37DRAFT_379079, partial [Protomyces lactucae-debilis]
MLGCSRSYRLPGDLTINLRCTSVLVLDTYDTSLLLTNAAQLRRLDQIVVDVPTDEPLRIDLYLQGRYQHMRSHESLSAIARAFLAKDEQLLSGNSSTATDYNGLLYKMSLDGITLSEADHMLHRTLEMFAPFG